MRGYAFLKRLASGVLFLAVLAFAGGPHHHDNLGFFSAGPTDGPSRIVSSHSPLSKASHWHSGKRVQDDPCLACFLHRFAAMPERAHDPAPAHADQFVPHAAPPRAAQVFRLCDPTRGPPSVS
jgi:hypothetical protein